MFIDIRPVKKRPLFGKLAQAFIKEVGIIGVLGLLPFVSCVRSDKDASTSVNRDPVTVPAQLEIFLDSLDLAQMEQLRQQALDLGVMDGSTKKKFPCVIRYKGTHLNARIRFKGDWTDHLETEKWSFRIELKDAAIKGKRTFSLQHPKTRGFAQEWLIHRLFTANDVITTEYDFLTVALNGDQLGIYAFEEHFDHQLLEAQQHRESVILKFDESLFWESMRLWKRELLAGHVPWFAGSLVRPFNSKRTLRSEQLSEQLVLGNGLLEMYRQFNPNLAAFLDVERFARYFAILTVANSSHSAQWHNMRLYVNPITALLEPIGFDCYGHADTRVDSSVVFKELIELNDDGTKVNASNYFKFYIFGDSLFQQLYLEELDRIADTAYLRKIFNTLRPEIDQINQAFADEFATRSVDTALFLANIGHIQTELPQINEMLLSLADRISPDTTNRRSSIKPLIQKLLPVLSHHEGKGIYILDNHGGRKVQVFGYRPKGSKGMVKLTRPVSVGIADWRRDRVQINLGNDRAAHFCYWFEDDTIVHTTAPVSWPAPKPTSPRKVIADRGLNHCEFAVLKDSTFRIPKGVHSLNRLWFIPSGYTLIVDQGATIILGKNGGIISESAIQLNGTMARPIIIRSRSENNHGLTILGADSPSFFKHVSFNRMSNLSWEGWTLTGGINCYDSEIELLNCTIVGGNSEDALNLIRSDLIMDSCQIQNTFSDAVDLDFSDGIISNCTVNNAGNDGLDFSGSKVKVTNCNLTNAGDKAMSCGERSEIRVNNVNISGANVGIASKDQSSVSVSDSRITSCEFGFAAYTKKNEYGGGSLDIQRVLVSDVGTEMDVEIGSWVQTPDTLIQGTGFSNVVK